MKTVRNFFFAFWRFSAAVAWENVVSAVHCVVTTF